jgi:hypothetical protein
MALIDTDDFTHRLHDLSAEEIDRVAAILRAELDSADGEVAWWRATIELTGALRRHHCTRQASLAAHRASVAVMEAARAAGIDDDVHRNDVTAVARAAAEAARVRVLLACGSVSAAATEPLLHPWHAFQPTAA